MSKWNFVGTSVYIDQSQKPMQQRKVAIWRYGHAVGMPSATRREEKTLTT